MKDEKEAGPMDDAQHDHPDEGTIHAWLDGALDDATSASLAAHVASCRECAERVAEARGLIAGASRIVAALDDVRTATGPAWGQAPAAAPAARPGAGSAWRRLRVTPARAAIAATVLVALGVSLTYKRAAVDTEAPRALQETATSARDTSAPALQPRDALLDSAVARNLAQAQPPRVLKAAPGPAIPVAEPVAGGAAGVADRAAPTRVAAGRREIQAQRDSGAGVTADQLAARAPAAANRADAERTVAAAVRADSVARASVGSVVASAAVAAPATQARMRVIAPPAECYRVESANGAAAAWGPVALPLIVRASGSTRRAPVMTVAGQPTETLADVTRAGDDSLLFRLLRIGYEGTLSLGAAGDARAGVMRSRQSNLQLSEVVTTAAPTSADASERRAAPSGRAKAAVRAPAPAPAAAAAEERSAETAAPAVPVVARRVACP
jgi:hypothetical protein